MGQAYSPQALPMAGVGIAPAGDNDDGDGGRRRHGRDFGSRPFKPQRIVFCLFQYSVPSKMRASGAQRAAGAPPPLIRPPRQRALPRPSGACRQSGSDRRSARSWRQPGGEPGPLAPRPGAPAGERTASVRRITAHRRTKKVPNRLHLGAKGYACQVARYLLTPLHQHIPAALIPGARCRRSARRGRISP